ncbi:hypothetical protein [Herbiconiux daphne]|uniref:DUF2029 domain-containing protein n=1 Tax=Herbiconiux daphne TaxID=2970914 RepID=A0ABT2H4M6_9MICO|nr:hypothetical protein [Herbiconiux daphne]MCS5734897.1 hypothetical protein [Herbiconiux daphne]
MSRDRFADWAFGRALTPARPLLLRAAVVVVLFAAGIVVTIGRLPREQRNVLWSEDGNQFLAGAFHADYLTNLFTPYAGYMHFLPRTAAQIVEGVVPTGYLGLGMNLAGAAVWSAAALAAFVFTRDRVQVPLRALLWILVLIVPIGSMEVATNTSNSHWFLMFGLFMALSARSGGVARTVFAAALVAAAVMSDPLALAFLPLVVARALALPRLRENIVSIAFVAAGVVQVLVALGTERDRGEPQLQPGPMAATYLVRVVWGDLVGQVDGTRLYAELGRQPVVFLAAAAMVVLAALIALRWRRSGLAAVALAGSLGFYAVTAVLTWASLGRQEPGVEVFLGGRYLVVPSLLLIVAIVATVSMWLPGPEARGARRVVRIVVALVVAAALIAPGILNYRTPDNKAGVPELSTSVPGFRAACEARPHSSVDVPIAPPGFTFSVPCERILAD